MASGSTNDDQSYREEFSFSESDSESSDTDENSDSDSAGPQPGATSPTTPQAQGKPCRYYNQGGCKSGKNCQYLHVCKYALKGNCRHGANCRLTHPRSRGSASNQRRGRARDRRSSSTEIQLNDGRLYQWQLDGGRGWIDIANDHILEAQYSLPNIKGIKIYNTPYGALCIDFKAMRIRGKKNVRVRRLDGQETKWIWYYRGSRGWNKFGGKDSKGNPGPAPSSEIERKYRSNPNSSFTFSIGSDVYELRFREMRQVSAKRKRKVSRRPKYQSPQSGAGIASGMSALMPSAAAPKWQCEGRGGKWFSFKHSKECSVSSADIETQYQQNPQGSMSFTVNRQTFRLDFLAMIQTNLTTQRTRRIKRV